MKSFIEIIRAAVETGVRDIFILAGQPVMFKTDGVYSRYEQPDSRFLTPGDTEKYVTQAYDVARRLIDILDKNGEDQFAISISGLSRVRVSTYRQRNSYAMVARIIPFGIPAPEAMNIPKGVMNLAGLSEGLVLICGPAESGKSTTLACLVNKINQTRPCHILTIEKPIEFLFRNNRAFISQREVPLDALNALNCLRTARWQGPDVVVLSEIEDSDVATELMTLADNHRLVFASVQAKSMPEAITQIIGMFPPEHRNEAAARLGHSLKCVVCQELVPASNGITPVFEIVPVDEVMDRYITEYSIDSIREYIRHEYGGTVFMNPALEKMLKQGRITEETAVYYSGDPEDMRFRIGKNK